VYFNIQPLPTLGITGGYSALFEEWNNPIPNDKIMYITEDADEKVQFLLAEYKKAQLPFYHGIDLRFYYTGLDKIDITMNNNVTFANVKGYQLTSNELYRFGWTYEQLLHTGADKSEHYLGINNVLGFKIMPSEKFIIDLQAANQLALITFKWANGSAGTIANCLGLYGGATFNFLEFKGHTASFQCGLALALRSYTHQPAETSKIFRAGYYDFGIPVAVKVAY